MRWSQWIDVGTAVEDSPQVMNWSLSPFHLASVGVPHKKTYRAILYVENEIE